MCVDVGETSSSDCLHMTTDTDSSVSGHTVKARKPYIITKQRERWTEEEHNKFLEALKQYGRAWRRIEEHIGSKSTVQIRSHAQKFFSKVVRESSNNDPGTVKSIDIPPPRPKRRPSHPYPRKVGYLSTKKGSFVDDQLWSFIPNQSVSEQESKSPTSVLTALESDTIGTTAFDTLKPCLSPVSCADRTVAVEEISSEQGSVSKLSSTSALCKDDQSTMVSDSEIQDPGTSKGVPPKTQQLTSLKLFGRTVIVSGELEHQESFSDCNDIDMETLKHQEQDKEGGERNGFYAGISHMAYCLPSHKNLTSPVNMVSWPYWWALYGGIPFGFSRPSVVDGDHALKEGCRTDSSTSSCYNSGNGDRSCFEGVVQIEESFPPPLVLKNSAFSRFKPSSSRPSRGFMPYKRCVVTKELKGDPAARAERS